MVLYCKMSKLFVWHSKWFYTVKWVNCLYDIVNGFILMSKLFVWHSKWFYTVRLMKTHKHFLLITWMLWKAENFWLDEENDKKKWKQKMVFVFTTEIYCKNNLFIKLYTYALNNINITWNSIKIYYMISFSGPFQILDLK